ncbi:MULTISPECIES: hypothetical protein [unclassified Microbacterium]|uniref:hypothetical protein n=1 Tax=unclassified Microbacterium TaxID=2609290 RepID=UPI00300FD32A
MTPNYEQTFQDRSEYAGGGGPQYRTPAGAPRDLSVGERARLLRREGIANQATPTHPDEPMDYGERLA